ncbi:hypothetical protein BKA82DRAFT_935993 [Pisolithus tinctorius]|uniref:protein-L-isoaspartate(D-aspartate) O-methyltransferase n=1 Tax=Pisolithus tinctorius Marx 270 TaxID=870435 RepID=A0A0C3JI21_PISTI|nr:hypothetical protein BKA82DRAFT_935993 [Pisolithus tinctorius]KIO08728.1 hypothetical protein M404DRAFT_935993 [Pisolithus tinctorius Marx 270]
MAWRCSGRSNNEPIRNLARQSILALDRVTDVRSLLSSSFFFLEHSILWAMCSHGSIGHGATLSAPHMVISLSLTHTALENMLPYVHPGATVVIVGSGSGYLAAVLHHLVSPMHSSDNPNLPQGKVIGIDHIPEVAERSKYNLENDGLGAGLTVRSN